MTVHGQCDPRFAEVRDEFERNFAERGEVGAAVCIHAGGRTVVDLWGGTADRTSGRPWDPDTLVLVWSCTKGAVAACAHRLLERGLLDPDAPVARWWPEFAQAEKGRVSLRTLLDHRAGLPAVREPLRPGGLYDWDYMTSRLAAEAPFWPPGTAQGYHSGTFGHLVGEVVSRAAGLPFREVYEQELRRPLGIDFFIGLPPELEGRVAPIIRADLPPGEPLWPFLLRAKSDPAGVQALALNNTGRWLKPREHDLPEAHQAVLPSGGGLASARGVAGLYAGLIGVGPTGQRLLPRAAEELAAARPGQVEDAVLLVGLRVALGFWKSSDNRTAPPGARDGMILGPAAFGHPGMGGSLGFADPAAGIAFGYVMNKQGRGVALNDRGQALVDATYRALGCRSNAGGFWA
jgi:CubicO group peptidase (beta-lactamase class C family)